MKLLRKILVGLLLTLLGLALLVALLFGHRDIPLEDLKAKYAGPTSAFVAVQGMQVHYRDEGNPADSLPLVLIHGTGASLHTFDAWVEELAQHRRVIRMDLPGYGLTGPFPDRNYAQPQYVAFIHDFLAQLGIEQCILGGNSLGGLISWQYAAQYPEQVAKLILIDAAGYPGKARSVPLAFRLAQIPVIKQAFTYITPRFIARASVENVYADKSKVTDELADRYFELTLRPGNRQAFVDRLGAPRDTTVYQQIAALHQPTLVLWGAEDQLIPMAQALRFHADLPNDTLVILKNAGHVPMEESPQESLAAVERFLRRW